MIRKCSRCGENTLNQHGAVFGIYGYDEQFKCSNCDFEIDVTTGAGQGYTVAMYSMFMLIVYFLFLGGFNHKAWDLSDYVIFYVLGIGGLWPIYFGFKENRANPVVGEDIERVGDFDESKLSFIHKILAKNYFIIGFLTPYIFVSLFLGFFAIIGFINYTFFDDKLFGQLIALSSNV